MMRLDLCLTNYGPYARESLNAAADVEAMGYDGIWLTDHVLGQPGTRLYGDNNWLEMLTSLAFVAANTTKVRLGTGILVVPVRDPVLTAKMLSTIDILSNGRLDVGVGLGWSELEYRALGRGEFFAPRGAVMDEALDVFLDCWKGGELDFERRWSTAKGVSFEPRPTQNPHPPLWVGALKMSGAPLARVAKYADVWHPADLSPEEVRKAGDHLDATAGRKIPRSIRLVVDTPAEAIEKLPLYAAAGCMQAAVEFAHVPTLERYLAAAETVLAAHRSNA